MKKLVISIVTWNSEHTIERCLESVLSQSFKDYDLFVVDNNSSDNTCRIIEKFEDERIKLIRLKHNTGFCGGHNHSINSTDSEFILLVNPDIVFKENYISNALYKINEDEQIGTVCGLLLQDENSYEKQIIDSTGLALSRGGRMQLLNHGKYLQDVKLVGKEVFGADGALPLYRRTMIEDVSIDGNYFDEIFFAHKEDWDVSWRAHNLGWKTFFEPLCVAIHPRHFKPNSTSYRKKISKDITFHAVKNQLILLVKNVLIPKDIFQLPIIITRQLLIFIYILVLERQSLSAYNFVLRNMSMIFTKRKKQMMKLKNKKRNLV